MNSLDNVTNELDYEHINRTIRHGNVNKIYLIISKGNLGAIDFDNISCQNYYIIIFYSSKYTL